MRGPFARNITQPLGTEGSQAFSMPSRSTMGTEGTQAFSMPWASKMRQHSLIPWGLRPQAITLPWGENRWS